MLIQNALKELLDVKTNPEKIWNKLYSVRAGLCDYIIRTQNAGVYETAITVLELAEGWEHYSGDADYIVPASRTRRSRGDACAVYQQSSFREMWIEGEYAKLRWDLVEYCYRRAVELGL